MLIIAKKLRELSFGQLMKVYREDNLENGWENWSREPEARRIALAEEKFYRYLSQIFFRTPGACYAIWQVEGDYVSALRLEPYRDGLLLEALETRPDCRRRGYAKTLIRAVQERITGKKIYAHVSKRNTASRKTHESCGFRQIAEYAVYIDGTVTQKAVTLCYFGSELGLTLRKPEMQELSFRQQLLSDGQTMSYNHAYGGTIDFPREKWECWYGKWIGNGDSRYFYRYLYSPALNCDVGEAAYHFEPETGRYLCDVIVHAAFRGRGFGQTGLKLLCEAASTNGVEMLFDEIAADNPAVDLFLEAGFWEIDRGETVHTVCKRL